MNLRIMYNRHSRGTSSHKCHLSSLAVSVGVSQVEAVASPPMRAAQLTSQIKELHLAWVTSVATLSYLTLDCGPTTTPHADTHLNGRTLCSSLEHRFLTGSRRGFHAAALYSRLHQSVSSFTASVQEHPSVGSRHDDHESCSMPSPKSIQNSAPCLGRHSR